MTLEWKALFPALVWIYVGMSLEFGRVKMCENLCWLHRAWAHPTVNPLKPMRKAVKILEKIFSYVPASVCGTVQSHLSLGTQGAEFVCGYCSHAMEKSFFDLVPFWFSQSLVFEWSSPWTWYIFQMSVHCFFPWFGWGKVHTESQLYHN